MLDSNGIYVSDQADAGCQAESIVQKSSNKDFFRNQAMIAVGKYQRQNSGHHTCNSIIANARQ